MNFDALKKEINKLYDLTPETIHGVGVSFKEIGGKITDQICITFYVYKKLSGDELKSQSYVIPKLLNIDGVDYFTDVVECEMPKAVGACYDPLASPLPNEIKACRTRQRPLKGGVNVTNITDTYNPDNGSVELGTLGLICVDKDTNTLVGLTNNHVIIKDAFTPTNQEIQGNIYNIRDPKKRILQWTEGQLVDINRDEIGYVKKYYPISDIEGVTNYIDSALIALKEKDGTNSNIVDPRESLKQMGLNYNGPILFASTAEIDSLILNKNRDIYSVGRTTGPKGLTNCRVSIANGLTTFSISYQKQNKSSSVKYGDLFSIRYADGALNVIRGGDSGSIVIADFNGVWKIIGQIFAANSSLGYACRIDRIKNLLNIDAWNGSPATFSNINKVDSYFKTFNQAKIEMSVTDSTLWPVKIINNNKLYWYAGLVQNPLAISQFYPAMGNHDYDDSLGFGFDYLNYFRHLQKLEDNSSKSSKYYEVKIGDSHFFILDSDPVTGGTSRQGLISEGAGKGDSPDSTSNTAYVNRQKAWFNKAIAESNAKWKFVIFHHPPYSSSSVHFGNHKLSVEDGWSLDLATAVFNGHSHNYERIERTHGSNVVHYFINGCGGHSLYGFDDAIVNGSQIRIIDYGFTRVEVYQDGLRISFLDIDSVVKDSHIIGNIVGPLLHKFVVIADLGNNGSLDITTVPSNYRTPNNNYYTYKVSEAVKRENPICIFTAGDNSYPASTLNLLEPNLGRFYKQYIGDYAEAIYEALSSSTTQTFDPPLNPDIIYPFLDAYGIVDDDALYNSAVDFISGQGFQPITSLPISNTGVLNPLFSGLITGSGGNLLSGITNSGQLINLSGLFVNTGASGASGSLLSGNDLSGFGLPNSGGCQCGEPQNITDEQLTQSDPIVTTTVPLIYNIIKHPITNHIVRWDVGRFRTRYIDLDTLRYELLFFGSIGNQYVAIETKNLPNNILAPGISGIVGQVRLSQGFYSGIDYLPKDKDFAYHNRRSVEIPDTLYITGSSGIFIETRSTTYSLEPHPTRIWTLYEKHKNGPKVDLLNGLQLTGSTAVHKIPTKNIGIGKVSAMKLDLEYFITRNVDIGGKIYSIASLNLTRNFGPLFMFEKLGGTVYHNYNYIYNRVREVNLVNGAESIPASVFRNWNVNRNFYTPSPEFLSSNSLSWMIRTFNSPRSLVSDIKFFDPNVYGDFLLSRNRTITSVLSNAPATGITGLTVVNNLNNGFLRTLISGVAPSGTSGNAVAELSGLSGIDIDLNDFLGSGFASGSGSGISGIGSGAAGNQCCPPCANVTTMWFHRWAPSWPREDLNALEEPRCLCGAEIDAELSEPGDIPGNSDRNRPTGECFDCQQDSGASGAIVMTGASGVICSSGSLPSGCKPSCDPLCIGFSGFSGGTGTLTSIILPFNVNPSLSTANIITLVTGSGSGASGSAGIDFLACYGPDFLASDTGDDDNGEDDSPLAVSFWFGNSPTNSPTGASYILEQIIKNL